DAEPSSGIGTVSATVTAPGTATATYDSATALVTIVLSGLPEGDNTVTLNVSDVAGNGPTTKALNFKVDTTKPLIEPSANWDPPMPYTLANATVLSVDVEVTETGSGIDPATVVATVDTGGSATTSVVGSVVTISLTGLKYGANVVTLNLSDNVGNAALPVDGTVNVTDTVAPVIDDTS
ncbi:MAG TPA: hypothetical protein DDZ84_07240, partial [Firmicutes bacterium]|nr:hypothetical protein [Bacillota bacterium]